MCSLFVVLCAPVGRLERCRGMCIIALTPIMVKKRVCDILSVMCLGGCVARVAYLKMVYACCLVGLVCWCIGR
jgi:hypothetical protein